MLCNNLFIIKEKLYYLNTFNIISILSIISILNIINIILLFIDNYSLLSNLRFNSRNNRRVLSIDDNVEKSVIENDVEWRKINAINDDNNNIIIANLREISVDVEESSVINWRLSRINAVENINDEILYSRSQLFIKSRALLNYNTFLHIS